MARRLACPTIVEERLYELDHRRDSCGSTSSAPQDRRRRISSLGMSKDAPSSLLQQSTIPALFMALKLPLSRSLNRKIHAE